MTTNFPIGENGRERLPITMPDAELIADYPELAAAAADTERLAQEGRTVRESLQAAQSERRQAEHDDIAAFAAAVRAGKPEPSRKVLEVDEKIEALSRKAVAVRAAQEGAARDLADVIARNRAAMLAALAKKIATGRRKVAAVVEEYADTRFAVAELEALSRWVEEFAARPRSFGAPSARSVQLSGRHKQRGDAPALAGLLEEMRADAAGPRSVESAEAA